MKNLYLTAICILLFGCGEFEHASSEMKEEMWCTLNSDRIAIGSKGPYVEIRSDNVHLVPQESQPAMQELLNKVNFLQISREMAKDLAPSIDEKEANQYYLVRAAALYSEESKSFENLKFNVFYFSETQTLNVYFFGLATQSIPKKVAILIAVKHRISRVNSLCEIAS
ncbi:hypothetical protein [Variovorax sp. PBS-H4]|uniref:hypothetical protein n=1 Tax=Variovorax sp. PBS-H4 TaxID=434008 RepID=UPI0013A573A5|nr:hypothetical protein [Variovorax sp. PBS-H4]